MPMSFTMGPKPSAGSVPEKITEKIDTGPGKTRSPFVAPMKVKKVSESIKGSAGLSKTTSPYESGKMKP